MRINARRAISEAQFWRDVYIAGGQVTFGVVAAIWFLPPFDRQKIIVLLFNAIATMMFIYGGRIKSKRI